MERRRPRLRKLLFVAAGGGCAPRVFSCKDCLLRGTLKSDDLLSEKPPHIEKDGASYYVSVSTRQRFFLPDEARTLVFEHCLFENGRKVHMHAFVVMPDHVHMLFTPLEDEQGKPHTPAKITNGIKGASSHSVNKLLGRKGSLWEPESFDRIPRSSGDFEFRLTYIVENPIAAGLAKGPDDYRWSWRESAQPRAAALHDSE